MSPEQVRGEVIGKRTDNWAFGCLFYELVTGRKAFARVARECRDRFVDAGRN